MEGKKQRLSITKHLTAEPSSQNQSHFVEKVKKSETKEVEILLSPLSSNDLKELEDESESMSQFQVFDSSIRDLDTSGIDSTLLKNAELVTASKNLNERFKSRSEDEDSNQKAIDSASDLNSVPVEIQRKQNKIFNLPMETSKVISTESKEEMKSNKIIGNMNSDAEIQNIQKMKKKRDSIIRHPFRHLVFSERIDPIAFKKFLALTFRGLNYCKKCLKTPSERFLLTKEVLLPEPKGIPFFP